MQTTLNIPVWRSRLHHYQDNIIVDFLEYGWPINYQSQELPQTCLKNHPSALRFSDHIDKFIIKEVSHGATAGPYDSNPLQLPLATSPLSAVPKKNTTDKRVVMDLSFPSSTSVNDGIPKDQFLGEPFKLTYPTIRSLIDIIQEHGPGCLLYKLDLRRAYRQLPVDPHDYHLLGFWWREAYFIDTRLPFGLRSAPQACQRVTNAITYMHAQNGYSAVNYLDDFGGVSSPDQADTAFTSLQQLLTDLGLQEATEKTVAPTTNMTFIGLQLDTITMTVSVPHDKINDIQAALNEWQHRRRATKRQLQSLIGTLAFVAACIPPGRIFMSRLLQPLRSVRKQHHHVNINAGFRQDLKWWETFLNVYNGISLILERSTPVADETLATDACLTGCGALCGTEYFHRIFPQHVISNADMRIHHLELLTVVICCKTWGPRWRRKRILIHCDNDASVHIINGTRSKDALLSAYARELWFLSSMYDFHLQATHIPGRDNRLPDLLSRWHLHTRYRNDFNKLTANMQLSEILVQDSDFELVSPY